MVMNIRTLRFVVMVVDVILNPVLLGMTVNTQRINGTGVGRLMLYNGNVYVSWGEATRGKHCFAT